MSVGSNLPKPLIDVKEFLPAEISPVQNGMVPIALMQKIHCGGLLYADAARAWNAMVRAASEDKIFINISFSLNAYKPLDSQRKLFLSRFAVVDPKSDAKPDAVRVEFDNKTYELQAGKEYVECPGKMSHGFGLAAFIVNGRDRKVRAWLDKNAAEFGFVREYDFIPGRFVYIKSREAIPERVIDIEGLPPEPRYSALLIAKRTGAKWLKTPSDEWSCVGMFTDEAYRSDALAVIDQGEGIGISEKAFGGIFRQCAGAVCTHATEGLEKLKCPILVTDNLKSTVEKLSALFNDALSADANADDKESEVVRARVDFYKKITPEARIFERKKKIAQRLLDIPVEDLKNAPEQFWYDEYLSLLQIRLENKALIALGKAYCKELSKWYDERRRKNERELAVLGLIQFIDPLELKVPFNENLWHKDLITDVNGVFTHRFTRVANSDDELSTYYLARQSARKHGKRKMRIVFLIDSNGTSDKMLLIYDVIRQRDDVDSSICLYAADNYELNNKWFDWFYAHYPDDKIYTFNSLFDLRRLEPDYIFIQGPYDYRRQTPGLSSSDLVKFTKVIHLSYGVTLSHIFIERLIGSLSNFYRNVYMMFCSGETVRKKLIERFADNTAMKYQHFEVLGYTALAKPPLPQDEHSKKTILWTPRWSYEARTGGSHFLEYKDNFVELRQRYGDKVNLSMRPHGNTFRILKEHGMISQEEIDEYKKTVKDNDIELYSASFDLYEQFRLTDILIGDYSSILPVWFITGRPIIYCVNPSATFFDEYKEMYECMYIAQTWDEVLKYLDDLVAGNDPLYERRQKAAENLRAAHADAAQKIVDRIVEDFRQCEDPNLDG